MASVSEYENNINRYRVLKDKINSLLPYLLNATYQAHITYSNLKNEYSLDDDKTPAVQRIKYLRSNIDDVYNHLKNVVLPNIDKAIANTNKAKEALQYQLYLEELERKKNNNY